jgi:hypothetical protein
MDHQAFAQLLGNYGEFFGAIAVVATLIYLALQVRQNTQQLRRVEMNEGMAQFSVPRMAVASDRDLAELLVRSAQAPGELDAADELRLHFMRSEFMWAFYHIWDRARFGTIDKEDWGAGAARGMDQFLVDKGASRWWDANRHGFSEGFQAEVERVRRDTTSL